ncbi:hypothetical protein ABRY23_01435 [Melioribacteraceae bacterium 4301-Me]|uniref:hypothetical protein n=1 Tax=Pyranulibacter aquaticus TaxID=3163344 RepID=UPI00359A1033
MKMNWKEFVGKVLNITLFENYGVVYGKKDDEFPTFYEIVFKTGKLIDAFDDGLLLEAKREEQTYKIFVPYSSIKCVEIF